MRTAHHWLHCCKHSLLYAVICGFISMTLTVAHDRGLTSIAYAQQEPVDIPSVSAGTAAVPPSLQQAFRLPYKQAGMTERQAAAYLLDRLAFGARPGDVERVLAQGLEQWLLNQLMGMIAEPELEQRLARLTTLNLSTPDVLRTYPNPGMILAQARREGVNITVQAQADSLNREEYRKRLREYAQSKGIKPQRELLGEMYAQKLLRAVYANNQLVEVLTDFWFNHFNVSITDNQARPYIMTYERDAIRPFVLGKFRDMLGATAKHPAMLLYLDNAQSTAPEGTPTTMSVLLDSMKREPGLRGTLKRQAIENAQAQAQQRIRALRDSLFNDVPDNAKPRRGINENYARELMELHTLGVDGGYTQQDVTEAARVLTGWTLFPPGQAGDKIRTRIERGKALGFVQEHDFLFRADAHDATEKTVLGVKFPAGGGKDEGERLLDMLAAHPSTATFISTKLLRRFVSDTPPQALITRIAAVFTASQGDIRAVMRAIVESPEFWSAGEQSSPPTSRSAVAANASEPNSTTSHTKASNPKTASKKVGQKNATAASATLPSKDMPQTISTSTTRSKIKSPFELAVSALRAVNATIERPRAVLQWVSKIGQPLYAYQAPTGFPDRADTWINTGALLNRMNFGLALALGSIEGVKIDLAALNNHHEPESVEDALLQYGRIVLPERNLNETLRLLKPVVAGATGDPLFAAKLHEAANSSAQEPPQATQQPMSRNNQRSKPLLFSKTPAEQPTGDEQADTEDLHEFMKPLKTLPSAANTNAVSSSTIAQVVGILLGSPEFQRR